MRITLGQLVNTVPALRRLYAQELPVKTSYQVYQMIEQKINPKLAFFDDKRLEIQKRADHNDSELESLLKEEVDLDIQKIHINIEDNINISPADLAALLPFIDLEGV